MRQARAGFQSDSPESKTPPWEEAAFHNLTIELLTERAGSNAADLVAADADVVQGLVGEIAELGQGAAILDPIEGDTKRVHGRFLFRLDLLRPVWPRFELDVVIHANN